MGILSGNSEEVQADFLFSTVQMMSKKKIYSLFAPEYFDYIIIDACVIIGLKRGSLVNIKVRSS